MLSFEQLREKNVGRCAESYHPLTAWSLTDWACAMGGEAGEAMNVCKKIRRITGPTRDINSETSADVELAALEKQLADELADVVIYADLLAARMGIDLDRAIISKFNATSAKVGSAYRLEVEEQRP